MLPEFGATLHYQINPLWRVNLGYTFLMLTNVLRPGDQIDTRLDPDQFPPPVDGQLGAPENQMESPQRPAALHLRGGAAAFCDDRFSPNWSQKC